MKSSEAVLERAGVGATRRRGHDEGPGLSRPRPALLGGEAEAADQGRDRRRGPDHDHDHLRNRPPHPQGRRAERDRRPHPRARRRGDRRGDRDRGHRHPQGRHRPHLLHHVLRPLRLLQARHVLALQGRRLDPREHHRRHPGRVRAHPARGHEPLRPPAEGGPGSDGHAQRHPPHRLRVRRAQRAGEAGRHGGHRRRRAHRPRRADDGAALLAGGDHHGGPRPRSGSRWHAPWVRPGS